MIVRKLGWAGVVLLFGIAVNVVQPAEVRAQNRGDLIDRARGEFDEDAGLALLFAAVGSEAGALDSLWTVATHEIAATLLRRGDRSLALGWLRLSARHGRTWPIDPEWFEPAVVSLYEEGLLQVTVGDDPGPGGAITAWQFPSQHDPDAPGDVVAASSTAGASVRVSVSGAGGPTATNRITLEAGSYEFMMSAPGFDTVLVVREVLAGVTTELEVALRPVLSADVERRVVGSLVRIGRASQPTTCTTGFVADADGWILTEYESVSGPAPVFVSRLGNATVQYEAQVSLYDEARNLAVLKLPIDGLRPLVADASTAGGLPVWLPHFVECDAPAAVPIATTPSSANTGPLLFSEAAPPAALGAPIIDSEGSLLGIVVDDLAGLRAAQISDLVERARQRFAEEQVVVRGGGGGSWKWVVGGLAAAGGLVVALAGGGGGGDTGGPPGTITITVP